MKKIIKLFCFLFVIVPLIKVDALKCYPTSSSEPLDMKEIVNFSCDKLEGESLTIFYGENDYTTKYFSVSIDDEKADIDIIDNSLTFESNLNVGILTISDGVNKVPLYVKNYGYDESTTTTTTTSKNTILYTVTLDKNDNSTNAIEQKTCAVNKSGDTCIVILPKLDVDGFNGWGSAPTCSEGNSGKINVQKDITYYACFNNREEIVTNNQTDIIILKNLNVFDAKTNEKIDFGIFSVKKNNYEFKVLNEIENLRIETDVQENINVEIVGNENLIEGENEVLIKLSNNNSISEYKLLVTRLKKGESIDDTRYLKSLVIGNFNINFEKEKFSYDLTIPGDISKLEINSIPENEDDKVKISGNENLETGSVININVGVGENSTTYKINITKESSINYVLVGAIAVIVLLIILLIVLIAIKSKKKKNNVNNYTSNNSNTGNTKIEVLDL